MKTENFCYFFKANAIYLRGKHKLTQQNVADLLNIKRSLVGAIEEGRTIGLQNVYAYSRHFNVTLDDLLTKIITAKDLK
jgi:transcriptional regulator with XRE-family HTH domain